MNGDDLQAKLNEMSEVFSGLTTERVAHLLGAAAFGAALMATLQSGEDIDVELREVFKNIDLVKDHCLQTYRQKTETVQK